MGGGTCVWCITTILIATDGESRLSHVSSVIATPSLWIMHVPKRGSSTMHCVTRQDPVF